MYDAISVLAEAFAKALRKKPDFFGTISSTALNNNNYKTSSSSSSSNVSANTVREVHCATGRDFTDSPIPFEQGERLAKYIRKVSVCI
jgi:hypothetical protein